MVYRKINVVGDYVSLSKAAAEFIVEAIQKKIGCVLGLPTGKTPMGMYRHLTELIKADNIDISTVTTFNLDEYIGLGPEDEGSFHAFMEKHLFSQSNFLKSNIHLLNGLAPDLKAECARYEEEIREAGGIDLQVVGIGVNGHIGFNEPGSDFNSGARVVKLTEATRRINSKEFKESAQVPLTAVTMGLRNIMDARQILLIAGGNEKSLALAKALQGPVTEEVPASILQTHDNLIVMLDKSAATLLKIR